MDVSARVYAKSTNRDFGGVAGRPGRTLLGRRRRPRVCVEAILAGVLCERPTAPHVICDCVDQCDRKYLFGSAHQELPQTLATALRIDQLRRRSSFFVDLFRLIGGHSFAPLLDRFAVRWPDLLRIAA